MDKKSKKLKETVNPKETSTTKVGQKQTKCVKFEVLDEFIYIMKTSIRLG